MWECTCGSVVAGDDSLKTAVKEAREELGIELIPENGEMLLEFKLDDDIMKNIYNVWLFRQDINIEEVVLQEGETCGAILADKDKILHMVAEGEFIGYDFFPYLDELFEYCEGLTTKKGELLQKIAAFKFVNPVKHLGGYKSEMTLSQVVTFLERQNIFFTKTMVQHYMKTGLLPPLINKRCYDKRHICALLIIHILKDIYSLEEIKALFEPFYDKDFESCYDAFIGMYEEALYAWKADLPGIIVDNFSAGCLHGTSIIENKEKQKFLTASLLMAQSAAARGLSEMIIRSQ
jgi:hypothetical protein